MSKRTYVFDQETQKFVEITPTRLKKLHSVIGDEMEALAHPATGEVITSKRKFRETTRANGCVEVGDEMQPGDGKKPLKDSPQTERGNDISEAMRQLERQGKLYTNKTIAEQIQEMENRNRR